MEKSLKKSSDSERYLPSDILFMVLVLLPTKLLLQMRSVCKLWRDIISDCSFIKAHLDRANDIHNNSLKRYMDNAVCMRSTGFEESWTRYELTIPMKQFSPSVEILASCNGLLLLGDDIECYYLWNPSTRRLHGSKKYVMWRRCDDSVYDSTTASIYNIKTEKWEMIEHFPYVVCGNAQGVTVNGAPHWVMYRDHSANDQVIYPVIVCFDLVEDRFKEILKPDWLDQFSEFEYGVFEEKLFRLPGWCGGRPLGYSGAMAFNEALYVESLVSPFGGDDNSDMIG
ncbi:F-box associated domain containing protein [Tanacetum coccineum]|uniref:F-box associated domain containing protein n=1 Tax=Tanacetum coccineum TaxID=301880 RepID=A0ABQ4ZRE7_9ASTR